MRQSLFLLCHKQGSACLVYTPEPLRPGCFLISPPAVAIGLKTLDIAGKTHCSCEVWRPLRPACGLPAPTRCCWGVCEGCGLLLGPVPVVLCRPAEEWGMAGLKTRQ